MKSTSKLFRIVGLAIILSLLMVAIAAPPALAYDEDIDLDPESGEIGDRIDIDGDDWRPSTNVGETTEEIEEVDIYFTDYEADEGDDIDDEVDNYERVKTGYNIDDDGDWSTSFTVPSVLGDGDDDVDVHGGTYYVCVTYGGADNIESVAEFTVIAAELTLDPEEGAVGTEVEISGVDFFDDEEITIEYDGDEIDIASGDDETDSDGEFTCTIIVPESTAGDHTIKVTDDTGSEALADFTVEQEITVTPTRATPSDSATVKGTGFGKDVDVTIKFGGDEVVSDETDEYGSFQTSFVVPVKSPGTYEIEARDEDNNKDTVDFTIAAGIQLSQATGNVGSQVTINGSGFQPNATVTITYASDSTVVATTTADTVGKFSATFTVPKSEHGRHTITATDGTNTVTTTFTMEPEPPSIPMPRLPLDGDKAKSEAYFNWDDVTDPSGVTYTLQIATDKSFTNIVLEKTGLTESEYTITKEEKLESTKKEAPYYWSVQAVDGASNESGWTTPGSFYIGFAFALTGWVLWVLMAIAGLLLLFIGFLLGKRTAFM